MHLYIRYYLLALLMFVSSFLFCQSQHSLNFNLLSQVKIDSEMEIQLALSIHPNNTIIPKYNHVDELGVIHRRYQQHVAGYPVEGAVFAMHQYPSGKKAVNGLWLRDMNPRVPKVHISRAELYKTIRKDFPPNRKLCWEINDIDQNYIPVISKVWFDKGYSRIVQNYQLVYKVVFYLSNPFEAHTFYIDIETGRILHKHNALHTINVPARAEGLYTDGVVEFSVDSVDINDFKMIKHNLDGNEIIKTQDALDDFKVISSSTNEWSDRVAVDCHWGAEKTLEYFKEAHNRVGMDGEGGRLIVNVHAQDPLGGGAMGNAYYINSTINIGDGCSTCNLTVPLSDLETIGHEIAHGITENTANLIYQGESGAINESMSDIFGVTITEYTNDSYCWEVGCNYNTVYRRMNDPKSLEMPAFYKGKYWIDGADVHRNSSIGNLWYYYLVEGGTGTSEDGQKFSIEGIGFEKSAKIAFRTLSEYLTELSDYNAYRDLSIQAAEDLFGSCSPEVVSVSSAWSAVGLGEAIRGTDFRTSSIKNPLSDCGLDEEAITLEIEFSSCGNSLPIGSIIHFFYSIDENDPVSEMYTLTQILNPNESLNYTFTEKAGLSSVGLYSVQAWVDFNLDSYSVNDTIQTTIENKLVQNEDVRLVRLLHPNQSTACGLTTTNPTVELQFLGCETLSSGSVVGVKISLDNSIIEEEFIIENDIEYGEFFELTLSGILEVNDYGIYQINVEIIYSGDQNIFNNSLFKSIEFFESIDVPFSYPFDDPAEVSSFNIDLGTSVDKDTLVDRIDNINESQAILFTGGDVLDLSTNTLKIDLVENEEDIWNKNLSYETRACICIDAEEWKEAYLSFDLYIHQVVGLWNSLNLKNPWAANMRVLVNGTPVTKTYGYQDQDQFENYEVDLTDFTGTSFEVCFQSKSLVGRNLYGLVLSGNDVLGDQVLLDNINVRNNILSSIHHTESESVQLAVFPNPVNETLNISFRSNIAQGIDFEIINILGEVVLNKKQHATEGDNTISISLDGIIGGTYIVRAYLPSNQEFRTAKIIVTQ